MVDKALKHEICNFTTLQQINCTQCSLINLEYKDIRESVQKLLVRKI